MRPHGILLMMLLSVSLPAAENWPQFRGPTGQGISAAGALPTKWSAEENIAWKVAADGAGWSSPIFVDGTVYLTAAVTADPVKKLDVVALDAATGAVRWRTTVFEEKNDAPKIHGKNSHASPTPIYEDGQLYVHFGHQGTARLDSKGNVIWKRVISYPPVHGNGGSPVLTDKALIFSCDGKSNPFVVALSRETGETLWKKPRNLTAAKRFSFCTPLLITVDGRQQLVLPGSGGVVAYAPETGEEIWWVRYGEGYSVVPRPILADGMVIVCTGFDAAQTWAIRTDGKGDVTDTHVAWKLKKGAPLTPSPLLVGDDLYLCADRGILSCLNPKTGEPYWQERLDGAFSTSPILAGGLIYCQNEEGETFVVRPSREKLDIVSRNNLAEPTLASFAVGDGALFIRTGNHLYRIGSKELP